MSEPTVDVIMRTGGRPFEVVERAVASLAAQTDGTIRLILVRHGRVDVEAVRGLIGGALRDVTLVDAPGANRGHAMAAGLGVVRARWFGFLDDDDYLLADHYRHLLHAAAGLPAPVFAYSDILVEDESAPEAGLHLFREGPAAPPIGRITDRISVHAFLAERAALQGLPFDRWGLATAEDALLVAALLSRSTPVHSPHATCVYVQGRGDASAYLSHPDRAADELAFAREIAPLRAAIESKFGAPEAITEAAWLAPFEAAARTAALFKRLRSGGAGDGLVAIHGGAVARPVSQDPAMTATAAALTLEAVAGEVTASFDGGIVIEAREDYAFGAYAALDLPSEARPVTVAVRVRDARGAFGLALAGADGALVGEARVETAPMSLEVQLSWDRSETPALIVRRLSALGATQPRLVVEAIDLAFPVAALTSGGDRAAAQAALELLASALRNVRSPALATEPSGDAVAMPDAPQTVPLGDAPWTYALSLPIPPEAARSALRVELAAASAPVFVLRVDEGWSQVGERVEAPAGTRPVALWLEALPEGKPSARLVLQAGATPGGAEVTLLGVFLYLER